MDQPQWELIKSIVDEVLTLEGPERDTYLATISREYPAISTEVIEILQGIEGSEKERFMMGVRSDQKNMLLDISNNLNEVYDEEAFIGREIGAYRITEFIGRGGMGTVFKASRADGEFQQEVAIKLIKTGISTENTILRFKIEREVLAGLQHPNIAHLFDGGVTKDGMPYLIMEYNDGMPIDKYCDEKRLTLSERLDLFKDVCAAVQYAHNKLIVHRDLKAQNIYVTREGVVKILDFGIAKLLDPGDQKISTVETLPGQKIWTPQYAAPEQVTGEPVSTATDIYALGILFCKILTGTYPYDLEGKNLAEMERIIKNSSPLMPSQAIKQLEDPERCAANRNTTVKGLQNTLQGDLDALISKSIRKEPEYRYQSVKELSDDIDRFKTGIPLIAREGTYRYRIGKFIRRNKASLAAAASFLIMIMLFAGIYTWSITEERNVAQMERDKLEQVVNFMSELFEAGNPVEAQGESFTAIDLLEMGVERAGTLNDQPVLKAELLSVIGSTYRGMNKPEEAKPLLEEALQIQRAYWETDHPDIANTLNTLGSVHWSDGKAEQADKYLWEALEMRRRLYGNIHPDVFTSMNNYALVLLDLGKLDEAEKLYLKTLEARKKYYGEMHAKVGVSLNNLAFFLQRRGKYQEAEKYFRETLAMWRELQGEEHSDVGIALNNLGSLLRQMGNYKEAEQMLKQSLEIRKKVYGPDHLKVGNVLNNLALVLKDKQAYNEAMDYAQQSFDLFQNYHKSDHNNTAIALSILGLISSENGRFEDAENYLLESLHMRNRLYPDDHLQVAISRGHLGKLYNDYEMPDSAEPVLRKALAAYEKFYSTNSPEVASIKGVLGTSLLLQKKYSEAESLFQKDYQVLKKIPDVDSKRLEKALNRLINLYEEWKKPQSAEKFRQELATALTAKL